MKKIINNILPQYWKVTKLGEYVEKQKGRRPKHLSPKLTEEFSIPYVDIKAFEKNVVRQYTDGRGCVLCEDDDFLIVWDGSRSGLVGKAIKGALGSTLVRINFPSVFNNYAFYFMRSKYLEINSRAKGSGTPHVDPDLLWNYDFPLPPLPEQHRIVARIEELFSELDNGIANLKKAKDQLKVYRQSVLKWAFELITTPSVKTVEECCRNVVDCLHSTAKFKGSGYYCVDTTCIVDSKILFEKIRYVDEDTYNQRISRLKPEYGDILFAREGTVGTTLIVPKGIELCLGQRMMMFRLIEGILPAFFMYYFQSPLFKSQYKPLIGGTTSPHLNIRDIKKFTVMVGTETEQKEIVEKIESRLSVADKLEETIEQSLQQSEALRQSILKRAFEGKLVPQDPNDEPAEVLLEGIKSEL